MQKQNCKNLWKRTLQLNSVCILLAGMIGLTSCSNSKVIDYANLSFESGQDLVYPKDEANGKSNSLPQFSEKDVIKESDYILEGNVVKSEIVNNSTDSSFAEYTAVYTIKTTAMFYAKDNAIFEGTEIKVETPLPDRFKAKTSESSENAAYISTPTAEIHQNRNYIICLKSGGEKYSLVAPYYRPIEKTSDGHYVFYEGWKSLLKNSSDVKIGEDMSEYKYRNDDNFISDFKALVNKYK